MDGSSLSETGMFRGEAGAKELTNQRERQSRMGSGRVPSVL